MLFSLILGHKEVKYLYILQALYFIYSTTNIIFMSSEIFSKRLKELRKKAGWSQQKLAEKAGLSYNVITKIEQGAARQPTIQTMIKLADAFGISLDEVVGRKNNTKMKG